ncbi:MAG TPA: hypothetical protein VN903_37695 [Polyangia bacterium]|nr:hypothetical protein [Polyangia bacterium]
MRRVAVSFLAVLLVAGCGKLEGFGGVAPPLASFNVVLHGDLAPLRPAGVADVHALRVGLVWGAQWLTEPFCVLPAESTDVTAVIDAGCRDPFGFVPAAVSVSVPIDVEVPTTLTLVQLPAADVMVGDVTSRIAFGSLVVFDDRDDSGTLELSFPQRAPSGGGGGRDRPPPGMPQSADIIYGASFFTMTAPDQRVAYREGAFDSASAFYPRAGCEPPPRPGFSVLGAAGFSAATALASVLAGTLPPEDPSKCSEAAPADATIEIAAQAPADVQEVGCDERTDDSSVRYREPPASSPDLANRVVACAHLPTFDTGAGSPASDLIQVVVSGHPFDRCKGLTHYTLRGCREDVNCPIPDWDFTASPPAWWPQCGL